MNLNNEKYLLDLIIALIEEGGNCQVTIRAMHLPGRVWLNWTDSSGFKGTAQIDGDAVIKEYETPQEAASTFIDYIVKSCDRMSYESY